MSRLCLAHIRRLCLAQYTPVSDNNDLNLIGSLLEANQKNHFYPLIFIPLTTKLYSTVDLFTNAVVNNGKDLLQQAQEIFLVGYRAQDEIIKDMFRGIAPHNETQPKTKLHVVGKGGSKQIMRDALQLSENVEAGNIYGEGFMRFAHSYEGKTG